MDSWHELDFINRNDELAYLLQGLMRETSPAPALVVLRSPSGFGKSRLTDRLSAQCATKISGIGVCIVEPEIQVSAQSIRLHDGFFIQRCAEKLTHLSETASAPWGSFAQFLGSQRWKILKNKKKEDWISDIPGTKSAYKIALDYAYRALFLGSYSPARLLKGDGCEAVSICTQYVESIISCHRVALIIRDVQHCDLQSLRTLLDWNHTFANADMILEYTSGNSQFEASHHKLFMRAAGKNGNFRILDLMRLRAGHLEHLIRSRVDSAYTISPEAYGSWNGNLHAVMEMQFRVGIGRSIVSSPQIEEVLGDLSSTLLDHVGKLSPLHRIALAVCLAHVESIQIEVLLKVMSAIMPSSSMQQRKMALHELVKVHGFLDYGDGQYHIHVEAVAESLRQFASFQSLLAGAECALRDFYYQQVLDSNWIESGMAISVRQVFRLCARTKDAVGLLRAASVLSTEIARSQDQSLYAEVIASAVSANPKLYAGDHDRLLIWAAELAYDVSSFDVVNELLASLISTDEVCELMRACALQETGCHEQALQVITPLKVGSASTDICVAANLVEALIIGCRGSFSDAREILDRITTDPAFSESPMLGYAYRFYEVTEDIDICIEKLRKSIDCFDRMGMNSAKAYSQAAAAVLVARLGKIEEARSMIAAASEALSTRIRDRHLLLNNIAAIELLSPDPDFSRCSSILSEALRYVRDDFCEITVLTNLALAHTGTGNEAAAVQCVDSILSILDDHDFASVDMYWPVCLNLAYVLRSTGQEQRAARALLLPEERAPPQAQNIAYWDYRYNRASTVCTPWHYLAQIPFHPLYLSHWLIDLDGLNRMRPVPRQ